MTHRIICLVAICIAVICSPAALGVELGDLELQSALNQTFSAEIELTNLQGFEAEEFGASLGSSEDFLKEGIKREDILLDLQFQIIKRSDSVLVVVITSSRRILEPFLDFMLEINWPSGRILREYVVLLDPPVFVADRIESKPSPDKKTTTGAQALPTDRLSDYEYGVTRVGNTLWEIATNVRPDVSISIQQTMLALQHANPEAFINNNINLLKLGHVLRIPDRSEILSLPLDSAIKNMRNQHGRFERYKRGNVPMSQLDASKRESHSPRPNTEAETGELRLVSSNQFRGEETVTGGNLNTQVLQDELTVVEKSLYQAEQKNTELSARLDDLEAQVQTLSALIVLKDDELAQLTAMLRKQQQASAAATPVDISARVQKFAPLLSNPFVWGGIGLLLMAVLMSALIFMRQKRQDSTDHVAMTNLPKEDLADVNVYETGEAAEVDLEEDELDVLNVDIEEEDKSAASETNSVLEQVEVFMAYGHFPQAIAFLQKAIDAEPTRSDIQLKLLEVYTQTGDASAFDLQLDQLRALGDAEATTVALTLRQKIRGLEGEAVISADAGENNTALGDGDAAAFDLDALSTDSSTDPFTDEIPVLTPSEPEPDDDEENNKLDLARAYIDMGDMKSAQSILNRVIASGTAAEIQEANQLLARIS